MWKTAFKKFEGIWSAKAFVIGPETSVDIFLECTITDLIFTIPEVASIFLELSDVKDALSNLRSFLANESP